jgi:DNA-binding response OmpR family regulator
MNTHTRSDVDHSPVWLAVRRPGHPAVVLVLDGDASARAAYENLDRNFDVFTARDNADMLRKAADIWPHVIILDAAAADAESLQAIGRLRQSSWTSSIPVIVVSDDASVRDAAFGSGCDAFLEKPLGSPVLAAQIRVLTEPPEMRSLRQPSRIVPARPAA